MTGFLTFYRFIMFHLQIRTVRYNPAFCTVNLFFCLPPAGILAENRGPVHIQRIPQTKCRTAGAAFRDLFSASVAGIPQRRRIKGIFHPGQFQGEKSFIASQPGGGRGGFSEYAEHGEISL